MLKRFSFQVTTSTTLLLAIITTELTLVCTPKVSYPNYDVIILGSPGYTWVVLLLFDAICIAAETSPKKSVLILCTTLVSLHVAYL